MFVDGFGVSAWSIMPPAFGASLCGALRSAELLHAEGKST
jgi:hypothetical protein